MVSPTFNALPPASSYRIGDCAKSHCSNGGPCRVDGLAGHPVSIMEVLRSPLSPPKGPLLLLLSSFS